ncbi:MAG: hypothetical protein IJN54_10280 [Lachnospiraceae bacterium]|nr:hypothetical protein [Lachnospiraceae bacterium]
MLNKLIKHEWRAFWKVPAFVSLFLAIFTLFGVIALSAKIWETDNPVIMALSVFVMLFYYIAIFVVSFVAILYTALRFYKNIYTDEGYLMHTLPVTQKSLILSKLIVSYIWTIIIAVVIILSISGLVCALLATTGTLSSFWENIQEIMEILSSYGFMKEFQEVLGIGFVPLIIVWILIALLSPLSNILMIYTSISLGQLFKKHKVGGAILSYIGIYTVLQIINSIVTAPIMFSTANTAELTVFGPMMYFTLGEQILLIIGFFFLTEWIMKRKLNLE